MKTPPARRLNMSELPGTSPRHWLKRIIVFFNDYKRCFTAGLVTAMLFYIYAWSAQTKPVEKQIPVEIQVAEDEILLNDRPVVTVGLQGNQTLIEKMASSVVAFVNPREAVRTGVNSYQLELKPSDIKTPFGIQAVSVKPKTITFSMDKLVPREVDVEAAFSDKDKLPSDYTLGKVTVTPAKVRVFAPASQLDSLKHIRTVPISLSDINHSFDCDQELDRSTYPKFRFTQSKVLVQVDIRPASRTRTFNALPVRLLVAPAAKANMMSCEIVSSPTVDVTVSGAPNYMDYLRKDEMIPYVDISRFDKPGLYRIDVRCAFENSVIQNYRITPASISVKLEKISGR